MDNGVLCVYARDLLKTWEEFFSWVRENEKRHLLLLRDEGDTPPFFLLTDPQVHILSVDADDELVKQKLWEFLFLPFSYRALGKEEKGGESHFARIERLRRGIHLVASDYRDMGKRVLANLLANFSQLGSAKRGKDLFGRFQGVPALICGAGPSLETEIEEIRRWENRALIFAGGASLNALAASSLRPDFTAALDPHPSPERFLRQAAFEIPFFYQSRVANELLSSIQAPRLWVPDSGGYPLETWMHERAGLDEPPFDAGWNVSTFCTALAAAMGCNPIIFVGLELSTRSEQVYARGIDEKIGKEFVEAFDVAGEKVYTKQDWLMAESWLEKFVKDHPDHLFLNATQGGLPLSSITRMPLKEAREIYGQETRDLKGLVHSVLAPLQTSAAAADVRQIGDEIKKSFEKCEELCIKLFTLLEKSYANLPGINGETALYEVELEEEIAYKTFLAPLWEIWKPLFLREAKEMDSALHRLVFFRRLLLN